MKYLEDPTPQRREELIRSPTTSQRTSSEVRRQVNEPQKKLLSPTTGQRTQVSPTISQRTPEFKVNKCERPVSHPVAFALQQVV